MTRTKLFVPVLTKSPTRMHSVCRLVNVGDLMNLFLDAGQLRCTGYPRIMPGSFAAQAILGLFGLRNDLLDLSDELSDFGVGQQVATGAVVFRDVERGIAFLQGTDDQVMLR